MFVEVVSSVMLGEVYRVAGSKGRENNWWPHHKKIRLGLAAKSQFVQINFEGNTRFG
jgi:hypothetical protein